MKLKYKKAALCISLGVLCIGAVTFTIKERNSENSNKSISEASASPTASPEETADAQPDVNDMTLEKDAYKDVNQLVSSYFTARVNCDMDALSKLVTNSDVFSEAALQKTNKYIEAYENIECYTLKGIEKDSYVVYAYSELKLKGVETLAPGLTEMYVSKNDDGDLLVFTGTMDEEHQNYMNETQQSEGVQSLISSIESKYKEARQKDKELDDLITKINGEAGESLEDTQTADK